MHPICEVDGCDIPENRDGLCLRHKIKTVRTNTESLAREREGRDVTGGMGTKEYVKDMYRVRREAGLPDPEPSNKEAAKYAPAKGPIK